MGWPDSSGASQVRAATWTQQEDPVEEEDGIVTCVLLRRGQGNVRSMLATPPGIEHCQALSPQELYHEPPRRGPRIAACIGHGSTLVLPFGRAYIAKEAHP